MQGVGTAAFLFDFDRKNIIGRECEKCDGTAVSHFLVWSGLPAKRKEQKKKILNFSSIFKKRFYFSPGSFFKDFCRYVAADRQDWLKMRSYQRAIHDRERTWPEARGVEPEEKRNFDTHVGTYSQWSY